MPKSSLEGRAFLIISFDKNFWLNFREKKVKLEKNNEKQGKNNILLANTKVD